MKGTDAGSAALITVLLLPMLLVTLVASLELGALRVVASRARAAADLATVIAIGDQDDEALRTTGRYRPASDAEGVARSYLAANLEGIQGSLGAATADIAVAADVAVFPDAGMLDPRSGQRYEAPAVRIAADVPIRTPAFGALLLPTVTVVRVLAASAAR